MSLNLGGMKWVEGNDVQSHGFKASSLGLPSFIDTYSPQFPIISVASYLSQGPLAGAGQGAFPRSAASGSVDFVKVDGKHQLSFGYMAVATDENGGRFHFTPFNFNNLFTAGAGQRGTERRWNRRLSCFDADGVACQWEHRYRDFGSEPHLVSWSVFAGRLEGDTETYCKSGPALRNSTARDRPVQSSGMV